MTLTINKNPLRYRGYYYDKETGFYYLNARYYDPVVHRFISAEPNHKFCKYDKNLGINAYNLYTYCGNDPVNLSDQTGEFIITTTMICVGICAAVGMAIGGIYGDIKANEKGYTGWDKARTILTWIGIGGLIGAGIGAALGPLVTYLTGFAGLSVTSAGVSTLSVIEFPELFHQCFSLPKVLEHMCRPDHNLGFLGDTADEIYWIVMSRILQVQNQWVEGSNEIWLIEKGVRITIRFHLIDGKFTSVDAFNGVYNKIIGHVINLLP